MRKITTIHLFMAYFSLFSSGYVGIRVVCIVNQVGMYQPTSFANN